MRALNVFLTFAVQIISLQIISAHLSPNAFAEGPNPIFLRPQEREGNALTEHFRNRTTKLHDAIPCENRIFYSHLATSASTLPGNRFAYEPFPGARFDGLLMNSLSYGLWNGMQIGTVPLFYLTEEKSGDPGTASHTSNYNFKWNFLSYENWEIALAYSTIRFNTYFVTPITLPNGTFTEENIYYYWSSFIVSYFFKEWPIAISLNTSSVGLGSDNEELEKVLEKEITASENILDVNYIHNDHWAFTVSYGKIKESAFELHKAYPGYGGTVTWTRNKKWFNQISLGIHHFNVIDSNKLLFSFSI